MNAIISDQVGSSLLYENDTLRIWKLELEPGQETPMHRHTHSYIWYAVQGGPLDCEDENGNDLGIFDVPTNSVFDIRYDNGELVIDSDVMQGTRFPATHKAKNVGSERYVEILFEQKTSGA